MTPTDAQIEAAAEAIEAGFPSFEGDREAARQVANVCLTAAAEVGKMDIEDCDGDLAEIEQIVESRALGKAEAEIRTKERERCARVADNHEVGRPCDADWDRACRAIAAAIREGKE